MTWSGRRSYTYFYCATFLYINICTHTSNNSGVVCVVCVIYTDLQWAMQVFVPYGHLTHGMQRCSLIRSATALQLIVTVSLPEICHSPYRNKLKNRRQNGYSLHFDNLHASKCMGQQKLRLYQKRPLILRLQPFGGLAIATSLFI